MVENFYCYKHCNRIEQGDILFNIPKIIPSNFISETPRTSVWEGYIKNIKIKNESNKNFDFSKLSYFPSPTNGIVLSQTCDIENDKVGTIIFAELNNYKRFKEVEAIQILGKDKKEKYFEDLFDHLRFKYPSLHFFPKLTIDKKTLGPFVLDFKNIFFAPLELIKSNLDLFWKARLISPAVVLLKEKIKFFFTRLAFDECIFLSDDETELYIYTFGRDKNEIMKVRNSCLKE